MKRIGWEIVYWPIAALTVVAWVFDEAMLAAHDWALKGREAARRKR